MKRNTIAMLGVPSHFNNTSFQCIQFHIIVNVHRSSILVSFFEIWVLKKATELRLRYESRTRCFRTFVAAPLHQTLQCRRQSEKQIEYASN